MSKSCPLTAARHRARAVVFVAAFAVSSGLIGSVASGQLLVDGYTQTTFGTPSPGLFGSSYGIDYVDAQGRNRRDAGIEVGEGSYDTRNNNYWRFDNQTRRHGNLYEMNSTEFNTITTGQNFSIADLKYFNAEVFATNSSTFILPVAVQTNFTNLLGVTAPTFNFDFRLTFTVNRPVPVDDFLEYVNPSSAETFTYGNKTYALKLKGFSGNGGQTFNSTFQLPEWGTVTSSLYAAFEEVSGPRLYVNATDRLVFQARVGTTATRTLEVQNSGAAGTTLTGTIEGAPASSRFSPNDSISFTLADGQGVTRDYGYTPLARSAGNLEYQSINVVSSAGTEDVVLSGQGVGPVYFSSPQAGGTLNVGRVIAGTGSGLLPISNTTSDGDLVELTDMTLRSLTYSGADAAAFNMTGINPGAVLRAGVAGVTGRVGTNIVPRGDKVATLTVDTDVNAPFGADGRDFGYTVRATVVEKRELASTPVAFGRVMVDQTTSGLSTNLSGAVTPDNFFTNPKLKATGASAGGVMIAADTTDRAFSVNTGTVIATRGVSGKFTTAGDQAGSVPLTVAAEGLTGEGNYSLSVPYTATAVRKRAVSATPVDFGRVVAGQNLNGFSSTVSSPTVADNFYTYPTLAAAGASAGGVTVGGDAQSRVFNRADGTVLSQRNVSAQFATPGSYSGSVPLNLAAEGLAGEGTYALGVNYTAQVVGQRVISATPVDFGRVMYNLTPAPKTTAIGSPATPDSLYTNPILRSTGASDGVATVAADPSDRTFNRNDGVPISTRNVSINFSNAGSFSGSIPLTVATEGLAGEAPYTLGVGYSATAVRKRDVSATVVDFGRFVAGQPVAAQTTSISSPATPDNFYTNPILDRAGAADPNVTVAIAATDRTLNRADGVAVDTRTVTGNFPFAGTYSGSLPLVVRPEGLTGEGTYSLSVNYVAEAVRMRQIEATPVNFGRVVAGGSVTGFQTQISSPVVFDDAYTRPVLSGSGATNGPVTVAAGVDAPFDRNDGLPVSTRGVSATFATTGSQSGAVPLTVTGEGLAGEGSYSVAVPWTASVVRDRLVTASPVNFGRVFTSTPVTGNSTLSTTGTDDAFTRVRLNAGTYTQGSVSTVLGSSKTFTGPTDTTSANLGASFTTPGAVSSSINLTTANGAVSGEGLAGESPNSVAVDYTANVFSRGVPSFAPDTSSGVYNLNFGTLPRATGTRTVPFSIYNLITSLNTANLEFDGLAGSSGNVSKFSTTLLNAFTGFTAGSERAWTASIDTSTSGTFSASYQFAFHDDRTIQGATSAQTLTLNLTGNITGGFTQPPRTTVYIVNPSFESLRYEPSSSVDIPLEPGQKTVGLSNTYIDNGDFEPRYIPGWFSNNESDSKSGVTRPVAGTFAPASHGGDNVAYLNGDSFRQNAIGTFNAGDLYDFSFKIARTTADPFFAPQVGIYLGNTLFEPLSFNQPTPGVNDWATWQASYRIDATNPLFGSAVSIRIIGDARSPVALDDFLLYIPGEEGFATGVVSTWTYALGGSWNETSKWSNGVPNGIDGEARLGSAINTPSRILLDTPVSLGKLRFENVNEYNVSGPGTLRMNGTGAGAQINVVSGSHVISADLNTGSNLQVDIATGNQLVLSGKLDNAGGKTITKSGGGTLFIDGPQTHGVGAGLVVLAGNTYLQTNAGTSGANLNLIASGTGLIDLNASQDLKSLTVGDGGTVKLEAGGKYIKTTSIAVAETGTLDLTDGALIVDYADGASPYQQVLALVRRAANFDNGYWDGPAGITSTLAGQSSIHGLAVVDNDLTDSGSPGAVLFDEFTPFEGKTVDSSSVLVKYTLVGDCNLDGTVDIFNDFPLFLQGLDGNGSGWAFGDFNYDGVVDIFNDFPLLLQGLDASAPSGLVVMATPGFDELRQTLSDRNSISAVPEPTSGLLASSVIFLLTRRRRSSFWVKEI